MNLPFLKKQASQDQEPQPPQSDSMEERVEEAMQQIAKWREMAQTKEGRRQLAAEFYQMAAALALLSMDEDELEQLLKEATDDETPAQANETPAQANESTADSQAHNQPEKPELEIPRGEPQPPAPKSGRPRSLREIAGMP